MSSLDALINRYAGTLDRSDEILTALYPHLSAPPPLPIVREAVHSAADYILDRWASGRKSVRTQMAVATIPNYPQEVLTTSLLIDAMVNMLDDLIDERLTKQEQGQLVLELLRVIALLNETPLPTPLRFLMASYIHKGAFIAVAEQFYYPQIQPTAGDRDQNILDAYLARSIDTDFFFRLPLMWRLGVQVNVDDILALARVARALALLHKDLGDGDHDRAHRTPSPVLLLGHDDGLLSLVVRRLAARAEQVADPDDPWLQEIASNLRRCIQDEERRCLQWFETGGEADASAG